MSTSSTFTANVRAFAQRNGEVDKRLLNEISAVGTTVDDVKASATAIYADVSDMTSSVTSLSNSISTVKTQATTIKTQASTAGTSIMITPTIVSNDKAIAGSTITFSFSSKATLKNATITSFTVNMTGFTEQTINATNAIGSVTYTIPIDTAVDTVLTFSVVAHDSYGNDSLTATKDIVIANSFIDTPSITTPIDKSVVTVSDGLTIMSSPFSVTNGSDTHLSSNWKITTDKNGANIILQSINNTSSKTIHTFNNSDLSNLTKDKVYYSHVQHTGNNLGDSPWSKGIAILPVAGISSRGFVLYRSKHDHATTVVYRWPTSTGGLGELRKMEVVDAQFRHNSKAFATTSAESDLSNFTVTNTDGGWYVNGTNSDSHTSTLTTNCTNEYLCNMWKNLYIDRTAKENCDVWMTYNYTDAVSYCRNISIDNINGTWDLPNEFQLIIIYSLSDILDNMDPTALLYPTLALGTINTNGRFYFNSNYAWAWSSTEYGSGYARYVRYDGYCYYGNKAYTAGVIPIRELA